jgi:drug/metabolite transporter (DMT)-like permease
MAQHVMQAVFQDALGPEVSVYSQASLVAESLADYLARHPGMLGAGAEAGGVALCVAGGVALAVATLLAGGAAKGGNLWMVVGLQMLVGSVALFPAAWLLEDWSVNWTWTFAGAFVYTILISGIAATMAWFMLIERIGATRAATFHFLNPFFGVAIAAAVLAELDGVRSFGEITAALAAKYDAPEAQIAADASRLIRSLTDRIMAEVRP